MKIERTSLSPAVLEQAAEWYWQVREADVPMEAIGQWQAWLQASAENKAAFAEIERTLRHIDAVGSPPWPTEGELAADSYDGSVPVAEWPGRRPQRRHRRRDWRVAARAAAVLVIGTVVGWLAFQGSTSTMPDVAIYETQAAEHRDVRLPDGSTVTLGGKSAISIAFTANSRLLILTRGAAFFDVARDTDRPFVVEAGSRRIAAVGTAFNVTRQVDRVVVTVTEGVVTVTPDTVPAPAGGTAPYPTDTSDGGVARLEAGHQLAYSEETVTPVTVADPAEVLAWRKGRLKYRGEALRYVVDDVNRYARRPIVLADEAAGQVSFTGTVFEQSIDSWLAGLEQVFPLDVEETPEGVLIRYKAERTD